MNPAKKTKGGAEKQRLKRLGELKSVAKDPKQKKLNFFSSSLIKHSTPNNTFQGKYTF